MTRGDVYRASLDPTKGHEQAGTRPVLIVQSDSLNGVASTVVVAPFTTNLKTARLPSCHLVKAGDGGLAQDSVLLCHQVRVIDPSRLSSRYGTIAQATMDEIDKKLRFTLGL